MMVRFLIQGYWDGTKKCHVGVAALRAKAREFLGHDAWTDVKESEQELSFLAEIDPDWDDDYPGASFQNAGFTLWWSYD